MLEVEIERWLYKKIIKGFFKNIKGKKMIKSLNYDLLNSISKQFGDAFYILDSSQFYDNYIELSESFKSYYPNFNIAYSYKTNYIPKLVQIVDKLGGYAEIVSDFELEIALKAGVKYNKIIWNGPVKNEGKIEKFLLSGGTLNIDSLDEVDKICRIANNNTKSKLNIGIRCNYDIGDGTISRFGLDVNGEDFHRALKKISDTSNIHLINLQVHFAKRSPELWPKRTQGLLSLYDEVVEKYNLYVDRIDLGGGIYGKMPNSLQSQLGIDKIGYDDYACNSAKIVSEHFKEATNPPLLLIEPGSALVGDCMKFVCRVETIKKIRGKYFATTNGSQKNISMQGINPPMDVIGRDNNQEEYEDIDIVGYTCIEGDILQEKYRGKIAVGDYIVFGNCGSYSLVMKPPFILPNYSVVDISDDSVELIKRAEIFGDLYNTFEV